MKKNMNALDFLEKLIDGPITCGAVIKARRSTLNLTQKDVADLTGLEVSYISSIENNKRSLGVQTAIKLAMAIGLHPSSILFPMGIELSLELREIAKKRKLILRKKSA